MDLTSYLIGRNSSGGSGGGSLGTPVIIAHEDIETGILDIKPSDIIDTNGNCYDKYYILKSEANGTIIFYNEISVGIDEDMIGIAFMASGVVKEPKVFTSSISEDSYFTVVNNNSVPTPNPLT